MSLIVKTKVAYIYKGKPVGLRFVQMVRITSRMGNSFRDQHVPFVQAQIIGLNAG